MTNQKTTKTLDATKLLGFNGTGAKVGDKAPTAVQSKVGNKLGRKPTSKVGGKIA